MLEGSVMEAEDSCEALPVGLGGEGAPWGTPAHLIHFPGSGFLAQEKLQLLPWPSGEPESRV